MLLIRTSYSSWQPTEKVQMAFITKEFSTLSRWRHSLALNRAVPKESVGQLFAANELVCRISFAYYSASIYSYIASSTYSSKNDATFLLVTTFLLSRIKKTEEKFILIFCTFSAKFHSLHTLELQTTFDIFFRCDLHSVKITCNVSLVFLRIFFSLGCRHRHHSSTWARLIFSGEKRRSEN